MKSIVSAVAVCVLGSGASANLLFNGNLDDPGTSASDAINGWSLTESAGFNAANFEAFANHTPGGQVGLWFRPFAGGPTAVIPVDAQLEQGVPAVPGVKYTGSAWFLFEENFSGFDPASGTDMELYLDFYGPGDVLMASAILDLTFYDDNDGEWRQYSVSATAPANTVEVRIGARMTDGVFALQNPQSAFADDFELVGVPAPGMMAVVALAGVGVVRRRR